MILIDASLALAFVLDESNDAADAALERVLKDGGVVPLLFWEEVSNVLVSSVRSGRLNAAAAGRAMELLQQLPLQTVHSPAGGSELMALAEANSLTAYDARYLGLAISGGFELGTLDKALIKAAHKVGAPVIP